MKRALSTPLFFTLGALFVAGGCSRSEEPFLLPPPAPYDTSASPRAADNGGAPAPQPERPAPAPAPQPARPGANAEGPSQIRASHILVMHRESMRVPPGVTRTKDEARARAQQVLARVRGGADFAAVAREMSDEPGHEEKAGDLGTFGRGMMVPPFEAAAFALRVGQISDVVETPFGFHVIRRVE